MKKNKKTLALHWKILIGMISGLLFGFILSYFHWGEDFVTNWIYPFGQIFIKSLTLIAVPLIIVSLIKGISQLKDISQFSSIGIKTITIYFITTIVAVCIGLLIVNLFKPGESIPDAVLQTIQVEIESDTVSLAQERASHPPLQFIVDIVPDNLFSALSDNSNMLQIIVFVIFFSLALLFIEPKKIAILYNFFDSVNDVILKMIDIIMLFAPLAVFALLTNLMVSTDPAIFSALIKYILSVVIGLFLIVLFYGLIYKILVRRSFLKFLSAISPAQLLAFSTSSSAATLPVTMESVEKHLGVDKEIVNFVCPIGATINMDGTSLYQAISAVFICQMIGFELGFGDQITIIITATLASIGSAAVPGAGIIMLIIVLEALNIPIDQSVVVISMMFAIDRPLNMLRAVVNITGDSFVASLIGKFENKLHKPEKQDWIDAYHV